MNRFRIVALGAASSTLAMVATAPVHAQVTNPPGAVVQDISGDPVANRLAEDMRTLAADPRNVAALVSAGRGALAMGDPNGALGFFLRAQTAAPNDGRAKAGIGSALLELERPGEALRMFQDAARLGVSEAEFAADRGLAYDLVGDTARAQRDYQTALARDRDDETVRRFALSLGIVGRRDEAIAMLDPLLRKQDRGAWRARAFVLAMAGDAAGAEAIARQTLPVGMAQMLQPYFKRLGEIRSPGARAFAVHYGELGGNAALLASRAAPVPTGPAPAPVVLASVATPVRTPAATTASAAPSESARSRNERRRDSARERRNTRRSPSGNVGRAIAVASTPLAPAPARVVVRPAVPIPNGAVAAPTGTAPAQTAGVGSAVPGFTQSRAAEGSSPAAATTGSATVTIAPGRIAAASAPVPTRVYGPPALGSSAALVATPATSLPTAVVPARTVTALSSAQVAMPVVTANATPSVVANPSSTGSAPTVPVTTASVPSTVPAQLTAAPPTAVAALPPAAPTASLAPVPAEAMTREQRTALLASIVGSIEVPESELASRPAASAEEVAAAAAVRELEAQSRRRSEAAAKRRADAEAARKAEADAEAAKRKATPERHWVQIATGANPAALARDFRRMVAAKPVLKGQDGWSARFGATRRMLVGPFASEGEAIAFMRKAKAAGVDGFNWTSPEGTEVEKLPGA